LRRSAGFPPYKRFVLINVLRRSARAGEKALESVTRVLASQDLKGVVEDLIDSGIFVTANWFNLAHPWPLKSVLELMAWQPELTGPSRETISCAARRW
jgi:primosomal protein N'